MDDALSWEKHYIDRYDSYSNGYNSTPDGRGCTAKQIINIKTGTIYESIKCASEAEGESHRAITRSANERNITLKGNLFLFLNTYYSLSQDEKTYLMASLKFRSSKKIKSVFPKHRECIINDLKERQLISMDFQL